MGSLTIDNGIETKYHRNYTIDYMQYTIIIHWTIYNGKRKEDNKMGQWRTGQWATEGGN